MWEKTPQLMSCHYGEAIYQTQLGICFPLFLLGFLLDPESRRDMPLRNVWLSPNYAALQPVIPYSSWLPLREFQIKLISLYSFLESECSNFSNFSTILRKLQLYPVLSDSLLLVELNSLELSSPQVSLRHFLHAQSGNTVISLSPNSETCGIKFLRNRGGNEVSVNATSQCLSCRRLRLNLVSYFWLYTWLETFSSF